jgi:GMP synthase-like glutamine amidotransferase
MKIGILMAGHAPEQIKEKTGDYDAMFRRILADQDFSFDVYDVENMEFPKSARDADGWLISGSKHGAYDPLPWIPKLESLIQDIYAIKRPLVGVCFGHQIIAQALGGQVTKYSGGWATGTTVYQFKGREVKLNAWHQDQVVALPPGASVLGGNGFCKNAMLSYGHHVFTVQPHPEFDTGVINGLLEFRAKGNVPDDQIARTAQTLSDTDWTIIAAEMARVFQSEKDAA